MEQLGKTKHYTILNGVEIYAAAAFEEKSHEYCMDLLLLPFSVSEFVTLNMRVEKQEFTLVKLEKIEFIVNHC